MPNPPIIRLSEADVDEFAIKLAQIWFDGNDPPIHYMTFGSLLGLNLPKFQAELIYSSYGRDQGFDEEDVCWSADELYRITYNHSRYFILDHPSYDPFRLAEEIVRDREDFVNHAKIMLRNIALLTDIDQIVPHYTAKHYDLEFLQKITDAAREFIHLHP